MNIGVCIHRQDNWCKEWTQHIGRSECLSCNSFKVKEDVKVLDVDKVNEEIVRINKIISNNRKGAPSTHFYKGKLQALKQLLAGELWKK